jgi:large subunit ribosomal protein L35
MATVKFKSKSAFHKRFKSTANGNLKRKRAFTSHLFINKTNKQKRRLRKSSILSKSDYKRARKMINYKSI